MRTIVWFRGKDLRLSDHPALQAALQHEDVVPVFVLDPYFFGSARAQQIPHRMQFLLESLKELEANIRARGSRLLVVEGRSTEVIPRLVRDLEAGQVFAQRWTDPLGRQRDRKIASLLGEKFRLFEGELLAWPEAVRTKAGRPYSVFTPFARTFRSQISVPAPLPEPAQLPPLPRNLGVEEVAIPSLEELGMQPNPRLIAGGSRAAQRRLDEFLDKGLADYFSDRDRMDRAGTSRLSADLKFGTISARQVWLSVAETADSQEVFTAFTNELLWREFSHSSLWDRPELLSTNSQERFNGFPWQRSEVEWNAWVTGRTGYPVVDAAARQLLGEGYVHNRARMISASFLCKHLLCDYREGEAHYLRYLVDGDWAQNNAGWQWSAGCGADAQPYFRVFNPISQGERFDPSGVYVRRWVPELRELPNRYVHKPWEAPKAVLHAAGIVLGEDYPAPIVDHREARTRFLETAKRHFA